VSDESKRRKKNPITDTSFLIFAGLAFVAASLCFLKSWDVFCKGWDFSISMFLDIMPRIIAAFVMAGFIEAMVPKDFITKWIGQKSGLRGIVIAEVAGILTPGGPMISFPLIAALYKLGADFGPLICYVTSWELIGIQRIVVWEMPFMGVKFVTFRFVVSLVLPIIAGLIARRLVGSVGKGLEAKGS
jgi:uncharacterized membrane protein YraQ (UPF0718 family)